RESLNVFAGDCLQLPDLRIVNAARLDADSPPAGRFDAQSELVSGFPYRIAHASLLAACCATLLRGPIPGKGLITDLDDTLWGGILGEVGVDGVTWHMESGGQIHGLYQRMLDSLAAAGTLVAV